MDQRPHAGGRQRRPGRGTPAGARTPGGAGGPHRRRLLHAVVWPLRTRRVAGPGCEGPESDDRSPGRRVSRDAFALAFTRAVPVVTMPFYTAGHAAVGSPLFLIGAVGRVLTLRPPLWRRTPLDLPLAAFGIVLVLSTAASAYRAITVPSAVLTIISSGVLFGSLAWL